MDANLFVRCGVKDELVFQRRPIYCTFPSPPISLSLTHSTRSAVRKEKFSGGSVVESFSQYVISRITLLNG